MFFTISETKTKGKVVAALRSIYSPKTQGSVQQRVFRLPFEDVRDVSFSEAAQQAIANEYELSEQEVGKLVQFIRSELSKTYDEEMRKILPQAAAALRDIYLGVSNRDVTEDVAIAIYGEIDKITKALKAKGYLRNECVRKFKERSSLK